MLAQRRGRWANSNPTLVGDCSLPRNQETLSKCRCKVGPVSTTPAQHQNKKIQRLLFSGHYYGKVGSYLCLGWCCGSFTAGGLVYGYNKSHHHSSVNDNTREYNNTDSWRPNTCLDEVPLSSFSLFEARIANVISSFKWRKPFIFVENRHLPIFLCLINCAGIKINNIVVFYLVCELSEIVYNPSRIRVHMKDFTGIFPMECSRQIVIIYSARYFISSFLVPYAGNRVILGDE